MTDTVPARRYGGPTSRGAPKKTAGTRSNLQVAGATRGTFPKNRPRARRDSVVYKDAVDRSSGSLAYGSGSLASSTQFEVDIF